MEVLGKFGKSEQVKGRYYKCTWLLHAVVLKSSFLYSGEAKETRCLKSNKVITPVVMQ